MMDIIKRNESVRKKIEKAMFCVLAFVALIAANDAFTVEYSEKAVEIFSNADPGANATRAELINSEHGLKLRMGDDQEEEGLYMYPVALPDLAAGHDICKNALGLHISNVGTFCNASYFGVVIDSYSELSSAEDFDEDYVPTEEEATTDDDEEEEESEPEEEDDEDLDGNEGETESEEEDDEDFLQHIDDHALQFLIFFNSTTTKPALLEIPVMKIPSEYEFADQNKLKTWANENNVGLLSADDVEKFNEILTAGDASTLNLKWLNDLLAYGLFKGRADYFDTITDNDVVSYSSRPLVLSENDLRYFTNAMDSYELK